MLGGSTASHSEVGLDCWPAQMAVEDCLRSFEPDALVAVSVQPLLGLPNSGVVSRTQQQVYATAL
jgi:hypothetical protein